MLPGADRSARLRPAARCCLGVGVRVHKSKQKLHMPAGAGRGPSRM